VISSKRLLYGRVAAAACYPHTPIGLGKVWIGPILFTVCLFVILCVCVCTVTDFFAEDKASGVKFCTAVHCRSRQGITHLVELCSPGSPNRINHESASTRVRRPKGNRCGRRVGSACVDIGQSPLTYLLRYGLDFSRGPQTFGGKQHLQSDEQVLHFIRQCSDIFRCGGQVHIHGLF